MRGDWSRSHGSGSGYGRSGVVVGGVVRGFRSCGVILNRVIGKRTSDWGWADDLSHQFAGVECLLAKSLFSVGVLVQLFRFVSVLFQAGGLLVQALGGKQINWCIGVWTYDLSGEQFK